MSQTRQQLDYFLRLLTCVGWVSIKNPESVQSETETKTKWKCLRDETWKTPELQHELSRTAAGIPYGRAACSCLRGIGGRRVARKAVESLLLGHATVSAAACVSGLCANHARGLSGLLAASVWLLADARRGSTALDSRSERGGGRAVVTGSDDDTETNGGWHKQCERTKHWSRAAGAESGWHTECYSRSSFGLSTRKGSCCKNENYVDTLGGSDNDNRTW